MAMTRQAQGSVIDVTKQSKHGRTLNLQNATEKVFLWRAI
jgi:hypothetical protein